MKNILLSILIALLLNSCHSPLEDKTEVSSIIVKYKIESIKESHLHNHEHVFFVSTEKNDAFEKHILKGTHKQGDEIYVLKTLKTIYIKPQCPKND